MLFSVLAGDSIPLTVQHQLKGEILYFLRIGFRLLKLTIFSIIKQTLILATSLFSPFTVLDILQEPLLFSLMH